jgi:hypothetical protein
MSNTHGEHASKASLDAMRENDAHTTQQNDAVPGSGTAHAHSHAAHESGATPHTKPAEDERTLISAEEQQAHRLDRGRDSNRGVGAGLRGDSGTRGQ